MVALQETPELRLLLACARAHPGPGDEAAIRRLLEEGVDWTQFARKALSHDLAGLAGHTLTRLVPDVVPDDILAAFQTFIEQTRKINQTRLNELVRLIDLLTEHGIETIPFKGPVLAKQAFDDLGLRGFRDLDFLIHDRDQDETARILQSLGYEREGKLTKAQFRLIHRLQGQEILFKPEMPAVEPHTRFTSLKMALSIDYGGLWRRARLQDIFGHRMTVFAPEDTLLVLAIHGGKELWWDIKWACDVADFIAAHPGLDWDAIAGRARAQGFHRMLLVAVSLARRYLGAAVPDFLVAAETADPAVKEIIARILARWQAEDPGGPPSNKTLSMDRLLLHDGLLRRAGYVVRTLFLPGPQHIPLLALPESLSFAYIPIGIAHDVVALPLYRLYRKVAAQADQMRAALALSPLAAALAPVSSQRRKDIKRLQQAYTKAQQAVAADPKNCAGWSNLGDIFASIHRNRDAVACYDRSLALIPDNISVWKKRNSALNSLNERGDLPHVEEAPKLDPEDANSWAIRAGYLSFLTHYAEAAEASQNALDRNPAHEAAARMGIQARLRSCDWSKREADKQRIMDSLRAGKIAIKPVDLKQIGASEEEHLAFAKLLARGFPRVPQPLYRGERYQHDRIRIAYLSTDFRTHAVGLTIVAPLEHHDRTSFETVAVSLGPNDDSPTRRRTAAAMDRFIDARAMTDADVAKKLRDLEIDIAVDLNGLAGNTRPGILAHRPAPIQAQYLGYPGTMAAPFIDYVIADHVAIPEENRAFYSEKVAYLPDSYLPCDRQREISGSMPSRAEEGLPESGFVFACFNSLYKVAPEIFDVWMRLLLALDGSVLWLPDTNPAALANLRREAAARGVAPDRLIFARFTKRVEDHLARLHLADLFLDTLPYNAHSTASDALWAGLPVLTCLGSAFAGRVAAGMLHAVGLPELVTTSLSDYEKRALELAQDPSALARLRAKLARNRDTHPLFDTAQFTRGLEAVYKGMWERQQAGLAPESFSTRTAKQLA